MIPIRGLRAPVPPAPAPAPKSAGQHMRRTLDGKQTPRRYWTPAEDAQLRALWAEGRTGSEISAVLGFSRIGVLARARRIGLSRRRGSGWSVD